MGLPAGFARSSSSMSQHTLRCGSSRRLCGRTLRVAETRWCVRRDKLIEQPRGASHSLTGGLKDTMHVYVINRNGQPLMPCKPAKARKLLRDGKARVARRRPFTILLLWDCEEHVQDVTLGIDKGSKVTGFACVGKGEVLLAVELYHRLDVNG